MSWAKVKLGDCCTKIGSGSTPKGGASVYIDFGVSFIRSQNVYNLHFAYDGLTHITDDAAKKLNGVTINSGDVLLNITGDSVVTAQQPPASHTSAKYERISQRHDYLHGSWSRKWEARKKWKMY